MGRFDNDTCSQVCYHHDSSIKMNTYKSHLYVQYVRQLTRKPTKDVGNTGPSQETNVTPFTEDLRPAIRLAPPSPRFPQHTPLSKVTHSSS